MVSHRLLLRSGPRAWFPLLAALLLAEATPAAGQGSQADEGVRVGISFGGIATFGITVEYFDGNRSLDLTVGTWSFRDLSTAAVVRHYFGGGDVMPFVGAGLWVVAAKPEDGRTGFAAVLHAPLGVDIQPEHRHALGLALNVNRALWVRRTDPEDDLPLNRRLVPLPEIYYRWTR